MKLYNALKCKCPKCTKGKIFNKNGNIFLLQMPKMNERCKKCNFKFEKETGFFFGAMFVSYAITIAEMIASLVIFWYMADLLPLNVFIIISIIAVLTSALNFRISRSIWIHIFFNNE